MKTEEILSRQRAGSRTTPLEEVFTDESLRLLRRGLEFTGHCTDGLEIFLERNALYQDAFVQIGVLGITAELIGAVNRLKPLVLRRRDAAWRLQADLIRNVLQDTHNFANIALMLLEEENWNGVG